jgi:hypothetical protein
VGHPSLSWQIGNRISMLPTDPPLRYMIRPSLDGVSPDHWNPRIEALDVHYNSGPMNRAFYFLSQGASSLKGAIDHSGALPGGMVGIGNHKAATIWYRALTTRLTAYSGYAEARAATLICAEELFGAGSPEATAVKNAFAAIGVGPAAGQAPGSEIRFWVQGPDQPEVHNGNWNPANPEIQYLVASGYSLQLNGTAQNLPSNAGTWSMAPGAQGEAAGRVEASGLYRSSGLPYTAIVRGASVHDGDLMDLAYIVPVQVDINGDREVDGEDLGIFVLSYNSAATVGNQGTNYTEAADFLSRGIIDNITGLFLLDVFKTTTFK